MVYNLPNATTPDGQFGQIVSQVPSVPIALLFFIYGVTLLAVHFGHKKSTGVSNFASSTVWSGLVTTISSLILFLIGGIINIEIVYFCMSITIISIIVLLFNED